MSDFLTVGDAARLLGVSASTLRLWDRAGKLVPVRHPLNGYRLYRRRDLDQILETVTKEFEHGIQRNIRRDVERQDGARSGSERPQHAE